MKERLLFYGINVFRNRFPIYKSVQAAAPVFPHAADTPLVPGDNAVVRAQMTFNGLVIQLFVVKRFFQECETFRELPGYCPEKRCEAAACAAASSTILQSGYFFNQDFNILTMVSI